MKTILITGIAGFIGYHLAEKLVNNGFNIVGIDNINDYYDVQLKYGRLNELGIEQNDAQHFLQQTISSKYGERLIFVRMNLEDQESLPNLFANHQFDCVVNLAAQAGVRYSIENPMAYGQSNLIGFLNLLECCRHHNVSRLLYASSSSVYGNSIDVPFTTDQDVNHPISLYAATKKANELMAHTYSHLYHIETIGLRFFTVYGPWGRPDMAYFSFTNDILAEKPIKVFNHGKMERDFTYIDDIVEGIVKLIDKAPAANIEWDESKDDLSTSFAPYKIYNIGNNNPVQLMRFINALESALGKEVEKIYMDMQPGDVLRTYADVSDLERDINFKPSTSIEDGLKKFVEWYEDYYKVEK